MSRPAQLWISHNVEHGHEMKRIHDGGGGMNSPELGQDAQGGKNSAHNDGSPSCAIRQRKHFAFLEFKQVGSYVVELASSCRSLNTQ